MPELPPDLDGPARFPWQLNEAALPGTTIVSLPLTELQLLQLESTIYFNLATLLGNYSTARGCDTPTPSDEPGIINIYYANAGRREKNGEESSRSDT